MMIVMIMTMLIMMIEVVRIRWGKVMYDESMNISIYVHTIKIANRVGHE